MEQTRSEHREEMQEMAETAAVASAEATWPQTRAILRVIFVILTVLGVMWLIRALEGVLLLVVLAIFFAYFIAPLVELAHRPFKVKGRKHMIPRAAAIGIVYAFLFGSLMLAGYLLLPRLSKQISDFVEQAPVYLTNARVRAQSLNQIYERLNIPPAVREYANKTVTNILDSAGKYSTEQGFSGILTLLGYIPWLILVPILAFFLLKDADSFRRSALHMLPRGRMRWRGDEFFQDVNGTLAAYIRAQLIACLLIGVICTLGFFLIGVRYALVLGLIAGLLEFIPLVGPLVLAVLAVAVASFYSPNQVVLVLLFLGVLRLIHDYVTYPRIIGSGIHLHPLAVILSILAGHELAGIAGIFLAIPVTAIITVTYRHWLEHRGSEGLVADLLKPAEQAVVTESPSTGENAPASAPVNVRQPASPALPSPPVTFID